VVRTAAARELRFPETDVGEDWVMAVSLALRGRVASDGRARRLYARDADSISRDWGSRDVLHHAAAVRQRIREDPMAPDRLRRLLPVVAVGQYFVLGGLRPVVRRAFRRDG
jgi:hypothetical protein